MTVINTSTDVADDYITANYTHRYTRVMGQNISGSFVVQQQEVRMQLRTSTKVRKTGLMLVGLGGNNGTTVAAMIMANKLGLNWRTREGMQTSNYFGSIAMSSTVKLGVDMNGRDVHVPMNSLLPMLDPNNLVIGGWDINEDDLKTAMEKACVLEPDLQRQLGDEMSLIKPMPSIYYPNFIAQNQKYRANNLLNGSKNDHLLLIRKDITGFKSQHGLEQVIVLWTATTERCTDIIEGVNDTADAIMQAVQNCHDEIAPSTVFAMAAIMEGCPFINGSPQNTLLPGIIELAEIHRVTIGGDDFKSGQTKLKSVLVDFLVSAGIKPLAITSYNHLGNNDGRNLSEPPQFRSKEISKSNLVEDMVSTNAILYPSKADRPDHTVVIKYVPAVGDSKRAMDEYYSEIAMGGRNTLAIHNTCEDSLLAGPLIIDLTIFTELMSRIEYRIMDENDQGGFQSFHPVMSILGYFLKNPVHRNGFKVEQSLFRQRNAIESLLRACIGLDNNSDLNMHHLMK